MVALQWPWAGNCDSVLTLNCHLLEPSINRGSLRNLFLIETKDNCSRHGITRTTIRHSSCCAGIVTVSETVNSALLRSNSVLLPAVVSAQRLGSSRREANNGGCW